MTTIYHTAFTVADLQRSRAFYEKIFGLKLEFEGERPEMGLKFVMLKDSKGGRLELLEFKKAKPIDKEFGDFKKIGIKHLAFAVKDIEKTMKQALEAGGKVIWKIKKGITVKKIAFIADPDGIPIEIAEL